MLHRYEGINTDLLPWPILANGSGSIDRSLIKRAAEGHTVMSNKVCFSPCLFRSLCFTVIMTSMHKAEHVVPAMGLSSV